MMRRFRGRLAALVSMAGLSLTAAACGPRGPVSASDTVVQFYVMLEVSGVRSIPEPRALLALEPYLTPSLAAQLRAAYAYRDSVVAAGARAPAPFSEGDPFSGLFEGQTQYVIKNTTTRGDSAFVLVNFSNTEQKPPVSWNDTVVVVRADRTWRVADIRYGAGWEFGYRGALTQLLSKR